MAAVLTPQLVGRRVFAHRGARVEEEVHRLPHAGYRLVWLVDPYDLLRGEAATGWGDFGDMSGLEVMRGRMARHLESAHADLFGPECDEIAVRG